MLSCTDRPSRTLPCPSLLWSGRQPGPSLWLWGQMSLGLFVPLSFRKSPIPLVLQPDLLTPISSACRISASKQKVVSLHFSRGVSAGGRHPELGQRRRYLHPTPELAREPPVCCEPNPVTGAGRPGPSLRPWHLAPSPQQTAVRPSVCLSVCWSLLSLCAESI